MTQNNNNGSEHVNQLRLAFNKKIWKYGFLGRTSGRIWRNMRRFRSI